MKVKSNAMPIKKTNVMSTTSKLLKQTKFKSSLIKDKKATKVDKFQLGAVNEGLSLVTLKKKHLKKEVATTVKPVQKTPKPITNHDITLIKIASNSKSKSIAPRSKQKSTSCVSLKKKTKLAKEIANVRETTTGVVKHKDSCISKTKHMSRASSNKLTSSMGKGVETKKSIGNLLVTHSKLIESKVLSAVTGLLKLKENGKTEFLDLRDPVWMQVKCIKIPICPTKQLRFKLPHPLVDKFSDVLLITADKKGDKINPEKAVEHYTELLEKHNVDFIHKVIPLRMLRQEYSQYEMKKKLVDQFDKILVDASVAKYLSRLLGKFIYQKPKMPIAVHLNRQDLKEHLERAVSKTQMTVKSSGNTSIVQVGHTKMDATEITDNIMEVSKWLEQSFPGGWQNIRSLFIKTNLSIALPVYLSLVSPNEVKIPVEQPSKKLELVEGELSTVPGSNVVVRSDGSVFLKRVAEEKTVDDSQDDEILEEAKKYMQSSKTVRYEESDDSDKEADAVTAAVEEQVLKNYGSAAARDSEKDGEEDEEEDDESSEEEDSVIPPLGKKRKLKPAKIQPGKKQPIKKQPPGKPQSKKLKKDQQQEMNGGISKRGSRGGKKNKLNKDQRKALIKRKKAGKK